jgi:ActR/RegA family two-component response regulator
MSSSRAKGLIWGYLKSKVYLMKPSNVDEIKNAIKEEITATPDNMVREAMRTLCDRLKQCR